MNRLFLHATTVFLVFAVIAQGQPPAPKTEPLSDSRLATAKEAKKAILTREEELVSTLGTHFHAIAPKQQATTLHELLREARDAATARTAIASALQNLATAVDAGAAKRKDLSTLYDEYQTENTDAFFQGSYQTLSATITKTANASAQRALRTQDFADQLKAHEQTLSSLVTLLNRVDDLSHAISLRSHQDNTLTSCRERLREVQGVLRGTVALALKDAESEGVRSRLSSLFGTHSSSQTDSRTTTARLSTTPRDTNKLSSPFDTRQETEYDAGREQQEPSRGETLHGRWTDENGLEWVAGYSWVRILKNNKTVLLMRYDYVGDNETRLYFGRDTGTGWKELRALRFDGPDKVVMSVRETSDRSSSVGRVLVRQDRYMSDEEITRRLDDPR
jgi:hypothetical protein